MSRNSRYPMNWLRYHGDKIKSSSIRIFSLLLGHLKLFKLFCTKNTVFYWSLCRWSWTKWLWPLVSTRCNSQGLWRHSMWVDLWSLRGNEIKLKEKRTRAVILQEQIRAAKARGQHSQKNWTDPYDLTDKFMCEGQIRGVVNTIYENTLGKLDWWLHHIWCSLENILFLVILRQGANLFPFLPFFVSFVV